MEYCPSWPGSFSFNFITIPPRNVVVPWSGDYILGRKRSRLMITYSVPYVLLAFYDLLVCGAERQQRKVADLGYVADFLLPIFDVLDERGGGFRGRLQWTRAPVTAV